MIPYSVSRPRRDHRVGPKPTMYWVTFTPKRLAGTMCPTSCRPMDTAIPIAAGSRTPCRSVIDEVPILTTTIIASGLGLVVERQVPDAHRVPRAGDLSFLGIVDTIEALLAAHEPVLGDDFTLAAVGAADAWARVEARSLISRGAA